MNGCVADHGCITCGDVAIPMRVVKLDLQRSLALCASADGGRESVEIALVEPVATGEWLLVHAGTALSRASERDAGTASVHDTGQRMSPPPPRTAGREVPA